MGGRFKSYTKFLFFSTTITLLFSVSLIIMEVFSGEAWWRDVSIAAIALVAQALFSFVIYFQTESVNFLTKTEYLPALTLEDFIGYSDDSEKVYEMWGYENNTIQVSPVFDENGNIAEVLPTLEIPIGVVDFDKPTFCRVYRVKLAYPSKLPIKSLRIKEFCVWRSENNNRIPVFELKDINNDDFEISLRENSDVTFLFKMFSNSDFISDASHNAKTLTLEQKIVRSWRFELFFELETYDVSIRKKVKVIDTRLLVYKYYCKKSSTHIAEDMKERAMSSSYDVLTKNIF